MKNIFPTFSLILVTLLLTSCSMLSNDSATTPVQEKQQGPIASKHNEIEATSGIEKSLDKYDMEQMSHALDKPLRKSTSWSNPKTKASYVVTPIEKTTFNGNPYCRKYSISSTQQGNHRESVGAACVSTTDSSWQMVH
jgi:surface antigen